MDTTTYIGTPDPEKVREGLRRYALAKLARMTKGTTADGGRIARKDTQPCTLKTKTAC